MKVVLLHDELRPGAREDERDVLVQMDVIAAALTELGHTAVRLPFSFDLRRVLAGLEELRPDVAFNLVESVGGHGRLVHWPTSLLDALGLPYTGTGTEGMVLTASKTLAKRTMRVHAVPTPAWLELGGAPPSDLPFPARYIVKSVWEEASVGIEDDSVVMAHDALTLGAAIAARAEALGGEAFAELYVPGREFNLSVLATADGAEVLPPAEIHFVDYGPEQLRIVGYKAKWDADSFEYNHTPRSFDFPPQDARLVNELRRLALCCWDLFHLRGYVRVDFRVDEAGRPWVLEINTNPCLSPDAGFPAACERAGLSVPQVIARVLADAACRGGQGYDGRGDAGAVSTEVRVDEMAGRTPLAEVVLREDVRPADVQAVRDIVTSSGYFRPDEVDVAVELVEERLARGLASGYHFVFVEVDGRTAGYTCYGPIACTLGSFDLYWIAVDQVYRNRRLGQALMKLTEERIAAAGGRRVYIETSGRELYASTQHFYERCGYTKEAVLADFYTPGDAKIVYSKALS